jgi:Predicted membrane protein
VFSKADQIVDAGEEVQKSVYPSVFDSQFVHGFMTSVSLFVLVSIFAAAAYFTDVVPVPVGVVSVLYVAPIAGFVRNGIKRRMIMYHFTGQQLIEEEGIMNKDYQSIKYDRIQDVQLDEDFEERMFNVGDLLIKTAGSSGAEVRLEGLKDPESYQRLISNRSGSRNSSNDATGLETRSRHRILPSPLLASPLRHPEAVSARIWLTMS